MELILEVNSLSFSYGNGNIFEDVSFSLERGKVICILGPNGAGKSTLIKCIAGIFKPSAGSVCILGNDTSLMGHGEIARCIGYVPQQNETVFPFTVLDFVVMGRTPHLSMFSSPGQEDLSIARESLEMVGISELGDKVLSNLSGGQRQLVLIARALTQKPSLLLLDEPTSHLDFGNQVKVLEIVRKLAASGISILMNTHMPDHAFLVGDSAAILSCNRMMLAGNVTDVVTTKNMSSVYRTNVVVREIEDMARKVCIPCNKCED
jgi:iron complex transport system ATP-binding protein